MDKASKIRRKVPGEDRAVEQGDPGFAGTSGTYRTRKLLTAAVVAVLTFAVYLPALLNGFVWDDVQYITANFFIRSINGNLFKSAFLTFQADNWHPLTWISHAIDYSLWGLNPLGHHLTNIVLHAINAAIVVLLLMQLMEVFNRRKTGDSLSGPVLGGRQALIASGVSGLLFGLHPLHVESVAWISERKDLLCALFFLLSIMSYVKRASVRDDDTTVRAWIPQWFDKLYLTSLGFFALALMSKPMAVTLPVVLLLLDWFPLGRIRSAKMLGTVFIEKLPFFALTLISSVLTILAQKAGGAMGMMEPVPLSTRVLVAARSLIAYLGKTLAPVHLVPYYPYPESVPLLSWEYLFPLVLVIGITFFCLALAKRRKVWLTAWGYFVVTLLPVLGFIQVGNQAMADRYTYLPSLGPFLLAGLGATALFEKAGRRGLFVKTAGSAAAVILLASMSYATIRQIGVWKDNVTFWNFVIAVWPESSAGSPKLAMPYNNLGLAYASQGQWDRAIPEYETALRQKPDYVASHYNLGLAYASQGRLEQAIAEYETALRLKPDSAGAHNNLGIAYASQGRLDRAIEEFETTARLKPHDAEPHVNLGLAYTTQGRWDLAIAEFQTALRLKPDDAKTHYNLGNAYASQGLWDSAAEEFRAALQLKPDFRDVGRRLDEIISRRR